MLKNERTGGVSVRYGQIVRGVFLERPNRFVAYAQIADGVQKVHVKNTGRCRELLIPGTVIWLDESDNPQRKTRYDLVAVEKGNKLINMDSQAPNRVFGEYVAAGKFMPELTSVKAEATWGDSRFDFRLEDAKGPIFVEVKGVTLEEDGFARFPDAPTERGVKHLRGLTRAVEQGYRAAVVFVVQMEDVKSLSPNDDTHPAFGEALRQAAKAGVQVYAYSCRVIPGEVEILRPVPVIL